jgi:hypothetical protein
MIYSISIAISIAINCARCISVGLAKLVLRLRLGMNFKKLCLLRTSSKATAGVFSGRT